MGEELKPCRRCGLDVTPEERLLQAIFGRENNVPMAEEVAFVDTVTNMAETLVRKYHASTSQQEGK